MSPEDVEISRLRSKVETLKKELEVTKESGSRGSKKGVQALPAGVGESLEPRRVLERMGQGSEESLFSLKMHKCKRQSQPVVHPD